VFAIPARLRGSTPPPSTDTPQSLPLRCQAWSGGIGDALVLAFRADGARNRQGIADCLLRHMDRRTGLSRPTHKVIAEETGLGDRTVTTGLRWLQDAGFAVREEPGRTARYAAPHLRREGRNQAAVYRLTMPDEAAVDVTCGPSLVVTYPGTSPRARGAIRRPPNAPRGATSAPRGRRPAADRRPSRRELRRAWHQQQARLFRERAPTLRRLSDAAVASTIRPYLDAGHTVEDLLHALDHKPDGTAHRNTDPVRCPARWLGWRLAHWEAPDGTILPGHRQQLAERAEAERQQREAERQAWDLR
jgi:DNA-binding transcriptional ArsR family regulator